MDSADHEEISKCSRALSSVVRLKILKSLHDGSKTIARIAKEQYLSVSSTTFHLDILRDAGLIEITYLPSLKGKVKICQNRLDMISVVMSQVAGKSDDDVFVMESPVGNYTDARLDFVSGFCTLEERILFEDGNYFTPRRTEAQLIWCKSGFVEYSFSNIRPADSIESIKISLEICSETLGYEMDWKSDIAFSLCGKRLCGYTSPSDYGDKPGLLSPQWWKKEVCTQYGDLKTIFISNDGCMLDGRIQNADIKASDFNGQRRFVFRIENPENAKHIGGFNIFGKSFGNHPQDIRMEIKYRKP